jgi:uncharacterized membrane protein
MNRPRLILLVLVVAAAAQIVHYHPLMPARMASHFDGRGVANGWMSRDGFVAVYVFVLALMAAMFFALPKALAKLPPSMINLPHRDYWLAPERRAKTGEMIEAYMNECGNATLVFMLLVFQMAFTANLDATPRLSDRIWYYLVIFMLYMAAWLIRFIRVFKLPPGVKEP